MIVYETDDGQGLTEQDFMQYVCFKIKEAKSNLKNWKCLISEDYWGSNLLEPMVLNKIKKYANL